MINPLIEKFAQLRKSLVELAPVASTACGKLLDEIEKGLAEEKAERIPVNPPDELLLKHQARWKSQEWRERDDRFVSGTATATDCLELAKQELWECMYSLPPEAPKNGNHVDGWHASAAAFRAEAMIHRAMKAVEKLQAAVLASASSTSACAVCGKAIGPAVWCSIACMEQHIGPTTATPKT